jgi:hypothetical protein
MPDPVSEFSRVIQIPDSKVSPHANCQNPTIAEAKCTRRMDRHSA